MTTLRVGDAPAVMHMGIDANGRRVALWIQACLPHPLGGLHAHHVGRCQVRAAPGCRNGLALHEFQHGVTGLAQPALVACPAHSLTNAGS